MTNDKLIEAMAIAMHDSDVDALGEGRGDDEYQRLARVALERAKVAGWRLVPVEPTDEMLIEAADIDVGNMSWDGAQAPCSMSEAADIYRAMLAAAPDHVEEVRKMVGAWVPVSERLPEAGIPVLAHCRDGDGYTHVIRAMYAGKHTLELSPSCEWWDECDHDEENDILYVPPGWYENNRFEETSWRVDGKVTHWMPLPQAPEVGRE